MPTVLTAPRLLRSVVTAIGVPRYVYGWELKKCLKLLRVPLNVSSVLTAPESRTTLLRAGATLIGPARYVYGWELATSQAKRA